MNILKSLFVQKDKKSGNKEAEMQWRIERNIAQDSCKLRHTSSIPKKKQQLKNLKKEGPKIKQFDLEKESALLPNQLVEINQVKVMAQPMEIDLGLLVGVMNTLANFNGIVPSNCYQVLIGPGQQISSLQNIRRGSLESLIVKWNQVQDVRVISQDLIEVGEQLVIVCEGWNAVREIFVTVQQILLSKYQDKYLLQVTKRLITNIYQFKNQFIVHFQSAETCFEHFIQKKDIFESQEITQRLLKVVTVDEYLQYRITRGLTVQLKKHIQRVKQEIQKELILKSLEQTLITTLVEEKIKEETMPYVIELQEDPQTQYYKRESQKETRESGSRMPQNSDLYYFIEQHSSEDQNDGQGDEKEDLKSFPEPIRGLVRSNSQNLSHHFEQMEADEEFFTKY